MRTTKTISLKVIISDVVCKLFANIDIVAFPFDSSQLFHGKIIFISRSRLWTSVLILKWATAVVTRIPPITHNHMIGIQALQSAYMYIYKLLYINTYIWMSGSESKSALNLEKYDIGLERTYKYFKIHYYQNKFIYFCLIIPKFLVMQSYQINYINWAKSAPKQARKRICQRNRRCKKKCHPHRQTKHLNRKSINNWQQFFSVQNGA